MVVPSSNLVNTLFPTDLNTFYPLNIHNCYGVVRRGSHQSGSPQNGLGDERTCGTTLASAYVLRRLSAVWLQLQMKERKSEWK